MIITHFLFKMFVFVVIMQPTHNALMLITTLNSSLILDLQNEIIDW